MIRTCAKGLLRRIVNELVKGTEIMATLDEVIAGLAVIEGSVAAVDVKLDAVKDEILALQAQVGAGTPVTQEQLDALAASVEALKSHASAVADEAAVLP